VPRKPHFANVSRASVPKGRNGKHKQIVTAILADLESLKAGSALKIPLADLGDTKANIRSALQRESHKQRRPIATAADEKYLYLWNKTV